MSPNDSPPVVPGYEITDLLASNPAGEVYSARDATFGREVAIKILRSGATPVARSRFLDETRITAQLPHPGIPPVFGSGETPDGRPFVVAKLVRGRSLEHILEDESPPSRLPTFIGLFEQLCQTIAYAHCHRVIHRDVKPGNVMIGAFGEVQVMGWGLAKVLGGECTPAVAPTDQEAYASRLVGIVGTPLYMPPEQARGQPADERSDVFGLGGILCSILTGGPPFRGENTTEVLRKAAAGDLADAFTRLDSCGADPELIELCKRCLASDPAHRPPDGGAVASRVSAYRIAAEDRQRDAAVAAGRADERRKRRVLQIALLAAVALLLLALGMWWNAAEGK